MSVWGTTWNLLTLLRVLAFQFNVQRSRCIYSTGSLLGYVHLNAITISPTPSLPPSHNFDTANIQPCPRLSCHHHVHSPLFSSYELGSACVSVSIAPRPKYPQHISPYCNAQEIQKVFYPGTFGLTATNG
ncbi:hypothetical protein BC827DRAFT_1250954 [Russula dissimulans]|nr:hypothetical protein BC827DRAFT_1250954 [Russula dissimulans]